MTGKSLSFSVANLVLTGRVDLDQRHIVHQFSLQHHTIIRTFFGQSLGLFATSPFTTHIASICMILVTINRLQSMNSATISSHQTR
jgi:hypothetical protein